MASSLIIETESGTFTGKHNHNGYYAGDFSDLPRPTQQQLAALAPLSTDHGADR